MLQIKISNERESTQITHADGPLELGRSESDSPNKRIVVDDPYVSRSQMRIEEVPVGRVSVENLGSPITYSHPTSSNPKATLGTLEIASGGRIELTLPVRLTMGYTLVEIATSVEDEPALEGGMMTLAKPLRASDVRLRSKPKTLGDLGDAPSANTLTEWFERLLSVQKSAAGSSEFYQDTAVAVVDLIGLDRCLILLRRDDERQWEMVARHARGESQGPEFSRKVIERVVKEKRTYFQGLSKDDRTQSLMGVEAVVASPLLDESEKVIGIVYGCRHLESSQGRVGIKPLEAQMVQLLAGAVSAGLTRLQKEAEAARARVQLEQFFSRELVQELERHPDLLEGRERLVTCLFADLRGFSRISELLGARGIYDLLHDVMDRLTDQIMEHSGVVIDYHGDGLAAMWNAPTDSAEHARNACLAAKSMQAVMPQVSKMWEATLGFPLSIGVGLNTGTAQVGNAGSSRRLKYGPLGPTVNLTSRVEGATKQLGVPVLITDSTKNALRSELATRRLCQIRVVGIVEPVTVCELVVGEPTATWLELQERYEQALSHFESQQFDRAQSILDDLLTRGEFRNDTPCHLLRRAIDTARENAGPDWQPLIQLTSK
jgi:adenylate cyclase